MEQATLDRFEENIGRVESLVDVYVGLRGPHQGRRPVNSSDMLRAAVVMLHAALEDFFRSLARERLPFAQPASLDAIPLAGTGIARAEKFTLAAVAKFKGQTVDELVEDSIAEYLDRSSYNHPGELKRLVSDLGVDATTIHADWDTVGAMMDRRHWIVHQADRNPNRGQRGHQRAKSLGEWKVRVWIEAVRDLVEEVATRF